MVQVEDIANRLGSFWNKGLRVAFGKQWWLWHNPAQCLG